MGKGLRTRGGGCIRESGPKVSDCGWRGGLLVGGFVFWFVGGEVALQVSLLIMSGWVGLLVRLVDWLVFVKEWVLSF